MACLWMVLPAEAAGEATAAEAATARVQRVVDRLRERLGLRQAVTVALEPRVARIVSVEPLGGDAPAYRLAMEIAFFARLTPDELEAAVAHELGHVWVFSHHPYLQTERLANQIAMRVVPRDSLVGVYRKMWAHGGSTSGDLDALLGPPPRARRQRARTF